jgi:hypothetical protein
MICLDCHQMHISWRVALNANRRDIRCTYFNQFRVSAMQQEEMQIASNSSYSPHIPSLERFRSIFLLGFEISSTSISDCLVSTNLFVITSGSLIASAFLSTVIISACHPVRTGYDGPSKSILVPYGPERCGGFALTAIFLKIK